MRELLYFVERLVELQTDVADDEDEEADEETDTDDDVEMTDGDRTVGQILPLDGL